MRKRRGNQAKTGIVYSTKAKEDKRNKKGRNAEMQKILVDDTKRILEEIKSISIYGIGEQKRLETRNEIKKINKNTAKQFPFIKRLYTNIIAEYIRLIKEKPAIATNNPRKLLEIMQYSYTYYTQDIASAQICRELRVYVSNTHKKINQEHSPKLRNEYCDILEKTAGLCKD